MYVPYGQAVLPVGMSLGEGSITLDELALTMPVDGEINDRIDDAYSVKSAGSPYLPPMLSNRTRAATVRVDPHINLGRR